MAAFDPIYFDSNVLIASNWPKLSAVLENLLLLARIFKIDLFLPRAVEEELEAHWIRILDDKLAKVERSIRQLTEYTSNASVEDVDLVLPDRSRALEDYRQQVNNLKEKWAIHTAPLTQRDIAEIFTMSVCHHPPFKEKDVGFRDTVIYLSVIDHLVKAPGHIGAFVSQDGIFSKPKVLELAKTAGASIEIYTNIEEVYKELDSRLEDAVKRAWDRDRKQAENALMARISEIQDFVSENFELSENEIGFGARVIAVRGLKVQGVRNVQTPPLLDRKEGEAVRISFEIEMAVTLDVERLFVPQPPSRLKVGQEAPQPEMRGLREILTGLRQEEQVLPWLAEAEAIAPPEDKEYRNIQFLSVRSKGFHLTLKSVLGLGLGMPPK